MLRSSSNALCPLTKVVEHSDASGNAGYFTKNARLLLTEFCEESIQILERIAKRPPAAADLVATASTWKGGRLCLSTKPQVGPDGHEDSNANVLFTGQINLDGKRILSGGDSVLVRKYVAPPKALPQVRSFESLPDLSPEAADMYKETKTMAMTDGNTLAEKQPPPPPPAAPDSSLKASATVCP